MGRGATPSRRGFLRRSPRRHERAAPPQVSATTRPVTVQGRTASIEIPAILDHELLVLL